MIFVLDVFIMVIFDMVVFVVVVFTVVVFTVVFFLEGTTDRLSKNYQEHLNVFWGITHFKGKHPI